MILESTAKSIQIVLGEVISTQQVVCVASYTDIDSTTYNPTPASSQVLSNGTTQATVVAAPAAGAFRQIRDLSFYNNDSITHNVIVRILVTATGYILKNVSLAAGAELMWTQESGWLVVAVAGSGGGTGANPTATIGLAAVNGVATTFLRSDGAPALGVGIVPTWTGIHTFTPQVVLTGGATSAGDIILTGTARRIQGDMSNATLNSRLAFQGSVVNGVSIFNVLPNGTATTSGFVLYNNSTPTNAGALVLSIGTTSADVNSDKSGSGTVLPLTLSIGGVVKSTFNAAGTNLNIPITTSAASAITGSVTIGNGTAATNVGIGGGNINAGGTIIGGSTLAISGDFSMNGSGATRTITGGTTLNIATFNSSPNTMNFQTAGTTWLSLNGVGTLSFTQNAVSTSQTPASFSNSNGVVGSITTSGTSTAYNTSSDVRLKTDIRDFKDSGAIIDAIKPRIYKFKTGEEDSVGFIAQELYQVAPFAVTVGDDDPSKIEAGWMIDYSKLVPMLMTEVKSLRGRVAILESTIKV